MKKIEQPAKETAKLPLGANPVPPSFLRPALVLMILFTLFLGLLYPFVVFGIGQIFFQKEARGSLLFDRNGQVLGALQIGQRFTSEKYFHPRPSSAGDKGYDADHSSGSNLAPTSQKLIDLLRQRAAAYREINRLSPEVIIPADAVTASGSGLDPHISVENALLQVPRIAAARHLSNEALIALIAECTENPTWGLFGQSRVNVLRLNGSLDYERFPL